MHLSLPLLEVRDLAFVHANQPEYTLAGISLSIQESEFIGVLWPSWIGKSTFLDLLAWLLMPTTGKILFQGKLVSDTQHELDLHTRHNVGIVFQNYGLFPWLTVRGHIDFGLLNTQKSAAEKKAIAQEVLHNIWLADYQHYFPHQLSGGMQQRLAVGSILANDSPCLLMDEPFSAIDIVTRHAMQSFLLSMHQKFRKTTVFVTHQIDEALLLSDRILIFGGKPWTIMHELVLKEAHPRDIHTTTYTQYRRDIYHHLQLSHD